MVSPTAARFISVFTWILRDTVVDTFLFPKGLVLGLLPVEIRKHPRQVIFKAMTDVGHGLIAS